MRVLQIAALSAVLVGCATSAIAQFTATPTKLPKEFPHGLACGPLSVWPPNRDDDPVHLIYITPGFKYIEKSDIPGPLETFNVVHNTVFGRIFNRSDQYIGDYLAQLPGKFEIVWKGSLKKNPAVRMTGRLWNESTSGRWYYSELIEERGTTRAKILSGCHANEGD